jgi:hypothetical protein
MIAASCVEFKPTIWHRLGYGACHVDFPDEDEPTLPPGAISTDIYIRLDWRDRLRLFVTGCLFVSVKTKTNVVVETAISRSGVGILWPAAMPKRRL